MAGEPVAASLDEARLVDSSCKDVDAAEQKLVGDRIRQMRADVDASYHEWAAQQPGCWAQYRWEALARSGVGYGYGGLGLSGSGQGGGGSAGGSIGIGHMGSVGRARSASRTNNQVNGVDEADIVKTDGKYVYLVMNGTLRIVEALKPRVVSSTTLDGTAREMFVEGDRAVVYTSSGAAHKRCSYGYDCQFAGDGSSTKISVFDVSDRTHPKLTRKIALSGSLMAARRIGNAVHTVVADGDSPVPEYQTWPSGLGSCGTVESVVRAKFAQLKAENEQKIRSHHVSLPTMKDGGPARDLCSGLLGTRQTDGHAFTTIVSFDLTSDAAPAATATIQSRPGAVFASSDALYLSVVHRKAGPRWYSFYATVDEVSEVHKFHIGDKAEATRYVGSGVVPGHVLNQFSMDEWYGYLRIATTKGRVPDPKVESVVSILTEGNHGNLVRVGAVGSIAPREDIRAVRFDGDRGYVVTFKKTDPLFVLDLYQPDRPKILGELKIPGFSTYLHRIDPDHLLSIGFAANDHGDFAYYDGIILQLFDVSKPTEPKLLHKEKIGTRGSSSEAATDHLAFNYFPERGLLAVPMTICEGGGDGSYGTLEFSGLLVYDVSIEKGFEKRGGIDHGKNGESCSTWWSNANSTVKRSVFLDDLVYSIAADRVKVQKLGHLGHDVADIPL
jgi:Beta propeller domain